MLEGLFVFQPSPWEDRNWANMSGLPLEEVWLPVDDTVTIFGWFVDAGPNRPVLLWFHGNAGNISHRLANLSELFRLGLSVLIVDYRGYGRSTGSPSEAGLYQDALRAYDYLNQRRRIPPDRIIMFGRSLGGPVAAEVALRRSAAGLILEGSFPSIQAMADQHYLGLPANWFVTVEFNLADKLARLTLPLLVIHGEQDSIVPVALGRKVFEAARDPKRWYAVPGADHNDVPYVGGQPYYRVILEFIRDVIPGNW
jgi:fermentation-respiration switch protein FrsA (DUF1100 family)